MLKCLAIPFLYLALMLVLSLNYIIDIGKRLYDFIMRNNLTAAAIVIAVPLLLSACAAPDTAITKSYDIGMKTSTGSNVLILVLDADVDSKTSVDQAARADNRGSLDATIPSKTAAAAGTASDIINALDTQDKQTDATTASPSIIDTIKTETITPAETTETGNYRGRTNGDRPTWYFSKNMNEYPDVFTVDIVGCKQLNVTNNGTRYDPGDGYLVKQSDVAGRGMAVLAAADCKSETARI